MLYVWVSAHSPSRIMFAEFLHSCSFVSSDYEHFCILLLKKGLCPSTLFNEIFIIIFFMSKRNFNKSAKCNQVHRKYTRTTIKKKRKTIQENHNN